VILVDTSIWVDFIRNPASIPEMRDTFPSFVTCGPVIQEVLQGLDMHQPASVLFRESLLALTRLSDPLPVETFLNAAEIFRQGRRRGYTIRSGVDCLIAAIAIENNLELWHRDRDFSTIAHYTPLRAVSRYLA